MNAEREEDVIELTPEELDEVAGGFYGDGQLLA